MRRTLILIAVAAATVATAVPAAPAAAAPTVRVHASRYGRILVSSGGRTLYLFTRDHERSACSGACARAWPPYIQHGRATVGTGVTRRKLGTTRRHDGRRQLTYAGHPLYFYEGDRRPSDILCQAVPEFGGTWYVVAPGGRAIR